MGAVPLQTQSTSQVALEPQTETQTAEDERHYPVETRFYLIMLSVGLVLILGGMDSSNVSVAIPSITDHFDSTSDVG